MIDGERLKKAVILKTGANNSKSLEWHEGVNAALIAIDEFIAESRKIPKAKQRKRTPTISNRIPKN